ncbi:hypothetical protein EZV62_008554 [Acer yangbiense]|uniref:DRBM domain-containing protein n=1 Tax=Acer yangbiense TaxID=1000413 RepID=A0A5C7IE97_9ROSI|nr:hypothetical protein EZV62_008554 [Acer yangbiense]
MLRLDAAGYLSSSVASVVQPLDFSFIELLLSGVLALQLHYVWSLSLLQFSYVHCRLKNIDSPVYTSTIEGPAHAPCFKVRVTVDGHAFESPDFFKVERQQSMLLPRRFIVFSSNAHADCSAPSISDSTVWEGLQEQEVICSTTESGFIHVFQTFLFQMVLLCCKLAK